MHDEHPRQSNDAPGERRAYPLAPVTRAHRRSSDSGAKNRARSASSVAGASPGGRSTERCLNVSNRSETSPHASHVNVARTAAVKLRRVGHNVRCSGTVPGVPPGMEPRNVEGGVRWRGAESVGCGVAVSDALRVNAEPVAGVSRPSLNRSASGSRARPISDVVSIRSTAIFPSRYAAEISSSTASRHSHMNSCASCCANPSNLARRRCTARFTSIGDTTVAPAARASSPRAPASASARVRRRAAASRANAENTGDVSRDAPASAAIRASSANNVRRTIPVTRR